MAVALQEPHLQAAWKTFAGIFIEDSTMDPLQVPKEHRAEAAELLMQLAIKLTSTAMRLATSITDEIKLDAGAEEAKYKWDRNFAVRWKRMLWCGTNSTSLTLSNWLNRQICTS